MGGAADRRRPRQSGAGGAGSAGAGRVKRADGRPVLVTGGAGFIGCNIADRLAGEGEQVVVYDSLARPGVERNLAWLEQRPGAALTPVLADVRAGPAVDRAGAGRQGGRPTGP